MGSAQGGSDERNGLILAGFFGRKPVFPASITLDLADGPVQVDLKHNPRARRYILRLDPKTGTPRLTIPARGTLSAADHFLKAQTAWLESRMARTADRIVFEAGAIIPIRHVPHRLTAGGCLRGVDHIDSTAAKLIVFGDPGAFAARTTRFLKKTVLEDYEAALARHGAALGRRHKRLRLTDTRTRWGSCSTSGTISLSWRLIFAPPPVLDYLAAHEMAHLMEMNHGPRFWAHVASLCPDYQRHSDWLKEHGNDLWRYGSEA